MISQLKPGDVMLYRGTGVFSALIRFKTWSKYSHCEVYEGEGGVVASRDSIGVGRYPFRHEGLSLVVRPKQAFDATTATAWFETVNGQGYDWLGLMAFFVAKWQGRENGRMFCSEMAVRFLRAGGVEPFSPEADADAISPGEFAKSSAFTRFWSE